MAVVTSPAGAKGAKKVDWTPLQGREVVIWPDHDAPGMEYAAEVHTQLKALGVTARVVDVPPTYPAKWDLADPAPAGVTPFTLQEMIDQAGPWNGTDPGVEAPAEPLRILDTSEWGIRTPPPLVMLIDGLVPQGQPGILGGRSNAGKSLEAIQMGQALALGCGLFGRQGPGSPRFSLYVSMEDGEEELERRWSRGLAITAEDHTEWSREQVQQVGRNFLPLVPDWGAPCAKTLSYLVETIERVFKERRPTDVLPGLILLDTLAALAEGEENKAEVQQNFWAACHRLTASTGATVMALHHSKKPMGTKPPPMSERMSFDFIRGSSAIVAGARFVLQMEPLTREEAEKLGLDGDRAAAGNFPVLALSKQVSGPKGDWILLEQRQAHEVGGGFFTPHRDSERLVAQIKSKGAAKKLNLLEAILVDVHRGIHDRRELARRNYPDLPPEEAEAKLTQALKDMRRKTRGWIQAGGMDLTAAGFLKAQALCLAEDIKSGSASTQSSTPEDDGANSDAN
jgi:RecA-family ATPase